MPILEPSKAASDSHSNNLRRPLAFSNGAHVSSSEHRFPLPAGDLPFTTR